MSTGTSFILPSRIPVRKALNDCFNLNEATLFSEIPKDKQILHCFKKLSLILGKALSYSSSSLSPQ